MKFGNRVSDLGSGDGQGFAQASSGGGGVREPKSIE